MSTVGVAALAGCLGQSNPLNNQGHEQDETTSNIPTGDPPGPLRFSLDEIKEAAVRSSADTDEIPAIDNPKFTDSTAGDEYLEPDDVVFGVLIDGQAKAYPQPILVWHEIVNDSIAELNYAVTYCPLTGTAIGYERGDTTFGVEGWLVNSNLILFDRETHSWWPQVLGTYNFQEVDLEAAYGDVAEFEQPVLQDSPHAELATRAAKTAILENGVSHLIFPDEVQTHPANGKEPR